MSNERGAMEDILSQDGSDQRIVYSTVPKEDAKRKKQYRHWKRRILTILAWTIVLLVVFFLVRLISSKVGRFESITDMLYFINQHFVYADTFKLS